jgi:hypothetical protein
MWIGGEERARSVLRELLVKAESLRTMPKGMVREVLYRTTGKSIPNQDCSG